MGEIREAYSWFGLEPTLTFGTMPDKHLGDPAVWEETEAIMRAELEKSAMKYRVKPKDGAFYAPKIDIQVEDALGREWQTATIQVDRLMLPERFDLWYIDEEGRQQRPVAIHRAIYGSLERFIGVLIEHFAGALPLWCSPVQAVVIPIADRHLDAGRGAGRRPAVARSPGRGRRLVEPDAEQDPARPGAEGPVHGRARRPRDRRPDGLAADAGRRAAAARGLGCLRRSARRRVREPTHRLNGSIEPAGQARGGAVDAPGDSRAGGRADRRPGGAGVERPCGEAGPESPRQRPASSPVHRVLRRNGRRLRRRGDPPRADRRPGRSPAGSALANLIDLDRGRGDCRRGSLQPDLSPGIRAEQSDSSSRVMHPTCCSWPAGERPYWVAIAGYVPAAIVFGGALATRLDDPEDRVPAAVGLAGLAVTFAAAGVQVGRIGFGRAFDHNALYHTLQAAGIGLFYRSAVGFLVRPRKDATAVTRRARTRR